jgi:hypothetical protein
MDPRIPEMLHSPAAQVESVSIPALAGILRGRRRPARDLI